MIKTVFTAMTLATLAAASPAFAATHHHHRAALLRYNAEDAYARATAAEAAAAGRSNLVIDNGQIVGADPDPFIRSMIQRDHGLPAE